MFCHSIYIETTVQNIMFHQVIFVNEKTDIVSLMNICYTWRRNCILLSDMITDAVLHKVEE